MKEWAIDLHMHTPLSPCGQESMLPEAVVRRALDLGLDVIAITDHNAIANAAPFMEAGKEQGLIVVPGCELQTQEDIHLVCLCEKLEELAAWHASLEPRMTTIKNNVKFFGPQQKLNRYGEVIGEEERMLLASVEISVDEAVESVHRFGGACIAAHIDRPAFSLWASLGAIPENLPLDGIELTRHLPRDPRILEAIEARGYKYVTASDAHTVEHLGEIHCVAYLDHWSLAELKLAMRGLEGREIMTLR